MTTLGKIISIFCAYYGVLLLALPITVIGNNFDKTLNAQQGRDNEQFIYECLAGITRSLDVEYRARSKLAPVPSSAYKMTLITAIISTFDTTKQTLLKDAISSANREAIANRAFSEQAANKENGSELTNAVTAGARTEHLRKAVEMLEGGDERQYEPKLPSTSSRGSMDYHQFTAAKRKQSGDHGDIVISASEASGAMYNTGVKLAGFKPGSPKRGGHPDDDLGASTQSAKMAGITWNNMPIMPRKSASDSKRHMLKGIFGENGKEKVPAAQQLKVAQEELQDAIAAWAELLAEDDTPYVRNRLVSGSGSGSESGSDLEFDSDD